jgi:N6-adenosine-specific RNA methylase IME4
MKKYKIIYADPPWSYNDKMKGHSFSLEHEYETQNTNWIKNLPVQTICENDCVLFMWATSPMLPDALEVLRSWGFKYKTVGFVWSKRTKHGKDVSNLGHWTMGNVEMVLVGSRGKPSRIRKDIKQLVIAERTTHSKKPDEVRKRIVDLFGDISRIELFAREKVEGWDSWGNEIESDIEL